MTTKELSRKQVIVSINIENSTRFMKELSAHVININRSLKSIKLEIIADFICSDNKGIIITTNKVMSLPDLQIIEKYIKNVNNIELNQVEALRLPQSKSFLKIIGISYFLEDSNTIILSDIVKKIIRENYIFNNIVLGLKLRVIKVSPKSNMSIVWIDIWDVQSSTKAKGLINKYFNVRSFIAIIQDANMNLDVPQCKNC